MKDISYICVLDHAPNMQAVVSKLPPNLQNKWRDQAVKRKRTNRAPTTITDLTEFLCLERKLYSAGKTSKLKEGKETQGTALLPIYPNLLLPG